MQEKQPKQPFLHDALKINPFFTLLYSSIKAGSNIRSIISFARNNETNNKNTPFENPANISNRSYLLLLLYIHLFFTHMKISWLVCV